MEITVICTNSKHGRTVEGATISPRRANDIWNEIVKNRLADGWHTYRAQIDDNPPDQDAPTLIMNYRLRNDRGDWLNVELYRVRDNF